MSKLSYRIFDGTEPSIPIFHDPQNTAFNKSIIVSYKDQKKYNGFRMELLFYSDKIKQRIKLSDNLIKDKIRVIEIEPIEIKTPHINLLVIKQMAHQELESILALFEGRPTFKTPGDKALSVIGNKKINNTKQDHKEKTKHHSGIITFHGIKERINGKKKFDQFCLELFDKKLEENIQVWGADLKRALDKVKADLGDNVYVTFNGYVDIGRKNESPGKRTMKKRSYTIIKVEK